MSLPELPGWLRYRSGTRPIVLIAPHGGERSRSIRRGDGMNDLYTAELTHDLARRLDAYAIVNEGIDRNEIDLNRISEVVARAPKVLQVLRDAVARAAANEDASPLVLFVHGWNISSLACDIGIGLRESSGAFYGVHPTVSPATLDSFVEPLRKALAERGLEGFVGHRYPASARDNVTQLFSGRHAGHDHADVDHLARLSLEGRVDAVQLELSIPLRWPGDYRERWMASVEAAVAHHLAKRSLSRARLPERSAAPVRRWTAARTSDQREVATAAVDAGERHGESVQAALADGSGLFMGVEPTGPGAFAARVCIAMPGGELALFVCEAPWQGGRDRFAAGGLDWRPGERVRYVGPAVIYDTHDAFVDLESGLRSARIAEVGVEISFGGDGQSPAMSVGCVRVGDRVVEVSPLLVRRGEGRFLGEHGVRARVLMTGRDGSVISVEDAAPGAVGATAPDGRRRFPGRIVFDGDDTRVSATAAGLGGDLGASIRVRVPVFRPAPGGGFVKVVFGVAELDAPPDAGLGRWALFEVVRKIRASG